VGDEPLGMFGDRDFLGERVGAHVDAAERLA
jgi:hypothetical protein